MLPLSAFRVIWGGALALATVPAWGVPFNIGAVEGQFDSKLSLSSAWGTASPSQRLIGTANGGTGYSAIGDDGRKNFRQGEAFTRLLSGEHALELRYGNSGAYLKGRYWYDFELKDDSRRFKAIDDGGRAQSSKASGGELLDAYVWHNYQLGDEPGTLRVGRQVLGWGQAEFIGGGIGAINPHEAATWSRPGSTWRSNLRPASLLYLNQNLTDRLAIDGFYQLKWTADSQANCGTFLATSDVLAQGCDRNLALGPTQAALAAQLNSLGSAKRQAALQAASAQGARFASPDEGVLISRGQDRDARDGGQFGLAVHYQLDRWNTDLGAYAMNYHSRAPIFAGTGASASNLAGALASAGVPASAEVLDALQPSVATGRSGYYLRYPQNIHLLGLSFSSTLPAGTRWKGEVSYRPNAPVQQNWLQVLDQAASGIDTAGYRRKAVTQVQTSLAHTFDGGLGADSFELAGEVGAVHVAGLGDGLDYGRDPVYGRAPGAGFTTANAWGYRARAVWTFNDVLPRLAVKPSLGWSHDVSGYSPQPEGTFEQGRKAVSVGLGTDYQRTWSADLTYTAFFGGRYSTLADRDFLSLSTSVRF